MAATGSPEYLVPKLLLPAPWPRYAEMLDGNSDLLVSDAIDGRLALIASVYSQSWDFAHRVGAIRNCLELGRNAGFDGVKRPLSSYFEGVVGPKGALVEYSNPIPPPEMPDADENTRLVTRVSMALLLARTWEQRRRILAAYRTVVDLDQVALILRNLEESDVGVPGLAEVVATAKAQSAGVAVSDAPLSGFLRIEVSGQPPLMTREERLQLELLAYVHTPSWVRRREILRRWREPLLTAHPDELDELWKLVAQIVPEKTIVPARGVLDEARRSGISAAFSRSLPPTQVIIASASWALSGGGEPRDRADDLRRLVHFYDPGIFPTMHALIAKELAGVMTQLGSESAAPLLEEAVEHAAEAAADLIGFGGSAASRTVFFSLGTAHHSRTRGNLAAHCDTAISCFEKATTWAADAGEVAEVGRGYRELATVFVERPNGVRLHNLEVAMKYGEMAVNVFRSLGREPEMAWALYTEATAYQLAWREYAPGVADDLADEARALFEDALAAAPADDIDLRSVIHFNLGSVYTSLGPDNTDNALEHLEQALKMYSRENAPRRWGQVHHSIGAALMRGRIDDARSRQEARAHFLLALEELNEEWLNDRRRTLVALGGLEFREHNWSGALERYDEAIAISDYLVDFLETEGDRFNELAEMRSVYERAALCLVRLGRPDTALPLLDAGNTRIARIVAEETAPISPLDLSDIRSLTAGDSAVVVPLITTQGSVLFVLTRAQAEPPEGRVLDLPTDESELREILSGHGDSPGWLFAYRGWLQLLDDPDTTDEAAENAHKVWIETISRTTEVLWRILMGPILGALEDAGVPPKSPVRIVPSKWLGQLPLGAAWRMVDDRPRCFIEDHPLVQTPSFFLLQQAKRNARQVDRDPSILVVVDDSGTLAFAEAELERIRESVPFRVTDARASQWSPTELANVDGGPSHLHIICHGSYEWGDPSGSGLELGDARTLSAREINRLRLEGVQLVALSACETGITDANRVPTEFVGLAGSFLRAGAPTVLSTLWVADDESTSVLMGHFYRGLLGEQLSAPVALQRAQMAVRNTPGFQNPFFWGLFVLFGL